VIVPTPKASEALSVCRSQAAEHGGDAMVMTSLAGGEWECKVLRHQAVVAAPPTSSPPPPTASVRAEEPGGLAHRLSLDLFVGAAVGLNGAQGSYAQPGGPLFATSLRLGIAVTPDLRGRLMLAPELMFAEVFLQDAMNNGNGTEQFFLISLPIGFEYDLPVKRVPGLSIYPQLLLGYSAQLCSSAGSSGDCVTVHQGFVSAAFGLRYVWRNRLDISFEPVNVPILFSSARAIVLYRTMASVGVTF
jgi:hypothetical protein